MLQIFVFCLSMVITQGTHAATPWTQLAPGIDYIDLNQEFITGWSHIHVFRVDLKKYQLNFSLASTIKKRRASLNDLIQQHHPVIAMNGGFFDTHDHPLGLHVQDDQIIQPMKKISWWDIFYVQNNTPHITKIKNYPSTTSVQFALQAGPRLLADGVIPHLKPNLAERTALGITKKGFLIMLVTEHAPITTRTLAHLMQKNPLYCTDALNLDGGSSSQLYAHLNSFMIHTHAINDLTDALLLEPLFPISPTS